MTCSSRLSESISALNTSSTDNELITLIEDMRADSQVSPDVVAQLATALANSGEQIDPLGPITADVASTGGPSSLSTLLTPLYLRAWGAIVPKLGVPGRPAGGIDCLAQIPGYVTVLDSTAVSSVIDRCGYAHFLATGTMAPIDGRMFSLRQRIGAQNVPSLVTASLLAKKLAVGIQRAGLEIRVAPWGNFGHDWVAARSNAALFHETATLLGITAYPVLTDAQFPYQPFIGRKESLIALYRIFQNDSDSDLARHVELCRSLAATVLTDQAPLAPVSGNALRDVFYSNLEAQGSGSAEFELVVENAISSHRNVIHAVKSGFYCLSLEELRSLFVEIQRAKASKDVLFPDPFGMILIAPIGSWVNAGDPVASVRVDDDIWAIYREAIRNILTRTTERPVGLGFEGTTDG